MMLEVNDSGSLSHIGGKETENTTGHFHSSFEIPSNQNYWLRKPDDMKL
jgi:hypothetical protein